MQISAIGALVEKATKVFATLVEYPMTPLEAGKCWTSYAKKIHALIHLVIVVLDTLLSLLDEMIETNNESVAWKDSMPFMQFFSALLMSSVCHSFSLECTGHGQKNGRWISSSIPTGLPLLGHPPKSIMLSQWQPAHGPWPEPGGNLCQMRPGPEGPETVMKGPVRQMFYQAYIRGGVMGLWLPNPILVPPISSIVLSSEHHCWYKFCNSTILLLE